MLSPLIAGVKSTWLKRSTRQLIPMHAPAASKAAGAPIVKSGHASGAPIV
jgi:hypothetical protein